MAFQKIMQQEIFAIGCSQRSEISYDFLKNVSKADYVRAADRLMAILAEEGIARLACVKPQACYSGVFQKQQSPKIEPIKRKVP